MARGRFGRITEAERATAYRLGAALGRTGLVTWEQVVAWDAAMPDLPAELREEWVRGAMLGLFGTRRGRGGR